MLTNKYEKYSDISLIGLKGFFWHRPTVKWLNAHGIDSVGKLFELTESINFEDLIQYSRDDKTYHDIYIEIHGSATLLKYVYLGLDPYFDENVGLDQLGFTRGARNQIARFSSNLRYDNTRDLIEKLNDQEVISKLRNEYKCDLGVLSEIISKSEIVFKYYSRKYEDDSLNTLKELNHLNQELESSRYEKEQLEQKISKLERKVHTILYHNEDHIDHVKMQKLIKK